MKNLLAIFLAIVLCVSFNINIRATEVTEESTTQKDLGKSEEKAFKKVEVTKEGKNYKTKLLVSLSQGYDNNVYLDTRRKEDTFSDAVVDASVTVPLNGRWDVFGGLSVHDVTYWDVSDFSLVDTDVKFGFNGKLVKDVTLKVLNDFEVVEYPDNQGGTYLGNTIGFNLNQKLPNSFFHSFGYNYLFKHFSERKARNGWGGISDKLRQDNRNTVIYELGRYFKKFMVRGFGQYYVNDSNDIYFDYYDYSSKKFGGSLIYLFTNKLSGYLSGANEIRNYYERTVPNEKVKEWDHTSTMMASLFYDLKKDTTLGFNYSYRLNHSNSPTSKYSGSIYTLGCYLRF